MSVWGRVPCGAPETGRAGRDEGGLWAVRWGEMAIGAARNRPIARNEQLCKGLLWERGRVRVGNLLDWGWPFAGDRGGFS